VQRQMALVRDDIRGVIVDAIQRDPDSSPQRRDDWQHQYEEAVLQAWRQVRETVLIRAETGQAARHPRKYDRVFQPVREAIGDVITLEFQRVRPVRPAPARATSVVASRPTPVMIRASGGFKEGAPSPASLPVRRRRPRVFPWGAVPAPGPDRAGAAAGRVRGRVTAAAARARVEPKRNPGGRRSASPSCRVA